MQVRVLPGSLFIDRGGTIDNVGPSDRRTSLQSDALPTEPCLVELQWLPPPTPEILKRGIDTTTDICAGNVTSRRGNPSCAATPHTHWCCRCLGAPRCVLSYYIGFPSWLHVWVVLSQSCVQTWAVKFRVATTPGNQDVACMWTPPRAFLRYYVPTAAPVVGRGFREWW